MTRYVRSYTSQPVRDRRTDEHGLRCNFRRLVNGGHVSTADYDEFVASVDKYGLEYTMTVATMRANDGLKNISQYFTL